MSVYAIYRCLYGSDFVQQSIESVLPYVDKAIVVWAGKPFADVTQWEHRGKIYRFPVRFDDLPERVWAMNDPRVQFVEEYIPNPRNQWTEIVNDIVIPKYGKPDVAMFMHVPMVWDGKELAKALEEFQTSHYQCANTWQIEIWRGFDWRIPKRHRAGAGFWNLRDVGRMPQTHLDCNPVGVPLQSLPMLCGAVHNLRYTQNPNIMFWRHLVVQAYVAKLGDSVPDPTWFEEKWLHWMPETRDLEQSLRWKHLIPQAEAYDPEGLPYPIKRDLASLREQTSNAAWKGYPECG